MEEEVKEEPCTGIEKKEFDELMAEWENDFATIFTRVKDRGILFEEEIIRNTEVLEVVLSIFFTSQIDAKTLREQQHFEDHCDKLLLLISKRFQEINLEKL